MYELNESNEKYPKEEIKSERLHYIIYDSTDLFRQRWKLNIVNSDMKCYALSVKSNNIP